MTPAKAKHEAIRLLESMARISYAAQQTFRAASHIYLSVSVREPNIGMLEVDTSWTCPLPHEHNFEDGGIVLFTHRTHNLKTDKPIRFYCSLVRADWFSSAVLCGR